MPAPRTRSRSRSDVEVRRTRDSDSKRESRVSHRTRLSSNDLKRDDHSQSSRGSASSDKRVKTTHRSSRTQQREDSADSKRKYQFFSACQKHERSLSFLTQFS